jgi:hypothetical protein
MLRLIGLHVLWLHLHHLRKLWLHLRRWHQRWLHLLQLLHLHLLLQLHLLKLYLHLLQRALVRLLLGLRMDLRQGLLQLWLNCFRRQLWKGWHLPLLLHLHRIDGEGLLATSVHASAACCHSSDLSSHHRRHRHSI